MPSRRRAEAISAARRSGACGRRAPRRKSPAGPGCRCRSRSRHARIRRHLVFLRRSAHLLDDRRGDLCVRHRGRAPQAAQPPFARALERMERDPHAVGGQFHGVCLIPRKERHPPRAGARISPATSRSTATAATSGRTSTARGGIWKSTSDGMAEKGRKLLSLGVGQFEIKRAKLLRQLHTH